MIGRPRGEAGPRSDRPKKSTKWYHWLGCVSNAPTNANEAKLDQISKKITSDEAEWPVRVASASMSFTTDRLPTPLGTLSVDEEVDLDHILNPTTGPSTSHGDLVAAFAAGQRKLMQRMSWLERQAYEEQIERERLHHWETLRQAFGTSLLRRASLLMEPDPPEKDASTRPILQATPTPERRKVIARMSSIDFSDSIDDTVSLRIKAGRQISPNRIEIHAFDGGLRCTSSRGVVDAAAFRLGGRSTSTEDVEAILSD